MWGVWLQLHASHPLQKLQRSAKTLRTCLSSMYIFCFIGTHSSIFVLHFPFKSREPCSSAVQRKVSPFINPLQPEGLRKIDSSTQLPVHLLDAYSILGVWNRIQVFILVNLSSLGVELGRVNPTILDTWWLFSDLSCSPEVSAKTILIAISHVDDQISAKRLYLELYLDLPR